MYYIYKVTIIPTMQYYFGGRYGKNAKLEDLGVTYFTKSSLVQNLLFTYGKDNARFEIVKVFESKELCFSEEVALINAHKDDDLCLNRQWNKETSEKISIAVKSFCDNNPEKAKVRAQNATESITGSIWIHNGIDNKRMIIKEGDEIPEGYVIGRNWSPPNKKEVQ